MELGNFMDENNYGGQINADFFEHPEMSIEETKSVTKKPVKIVWDWKKSIARNLMMGFHTEFIYNKFQKLIETNKDKDKILKYLQNNDGLLGRIFVDTSFFDDKFDYDSIPQHMKQYNLYAINSPAVIYCETQVYQSSGDGTMDGFLDCEDKVVSKKIELDAYTELPILYNISEVDDQQIDSVIKLMLANKVINLGKYHQMMKSANKLIAIKNVWRNEFINKFGNVNTTKSNDVSEFDIQDSELKVPVGRKIDVSPIENKEQRLDDIGQTEIKNSIDVDVNDEKTSDGTENYFDNIVVDNERADVDQNEYYSLDNSNDQIEFEDDTYLKDDIDLDTDYSTKDDWEINDVSVKDEFDFDDDQYNSMDDDDEEIKFDKKNKDFDISTKFSFDF